MLIESFSEIKKKKDMYQKGKIINDVLIKSKQNSLDCVFSFCCSYTLPQVTIDSKLN